MDDWSHHTDLPHFLEVLLPRRHRLHDFESDLRCCPRIALQVRLQALWGSRSQKGGQLLAVKNCHRAMSLLLDIARLSLEILSWPHGNRFSTSFLSVCLTYNCQRYIRKKQMQMICGNHRYSIECQNLTLGSSLGFELFQRIPESHGILEGDERQLEALVRRNKRWIRCWEQFMYLVHTRGWYMLRCFLLEDLEDLIYLHFHSSCILHIHSIKLLLIPHCILNMPNWTAESLYDSNDTHQGNLGCSKFERHSCL